LGAMNHTLQISGRIIVMKMTIKLLLYLGLITLVPTAWVIKEEKRQKFFDKGNKGNAFYEKVEYIKASKELKNNLQIHHNFVKIYSQIQERILDEIILKEGIDANRRSIKSSGMLYSAIAWV
jgi:hypothetical protein